MNKTIEKLLEKDESYKKLVLEYDIKKVMNSIEVKKAIFGKDFKEWVNGVNENITHDNIVHKWKYQTKKKMVYREAYAFILRYYKGMTYREIGEHIEVTRERARQIIVSCTKQMKHPRFGRKVFKIIR